MSELYPETGASNAETNPEEMPFHRACEVIDELAERSESSLEEFYYDSNRNSYYSYTKVENERPDLPNDFYVYPPDKGLIDINGEEYKAALAIQENAKEYLSKLEEQHQDIKTVIRQEAIFQGARIQIVGSSKPELNQIEDMGSRYQAQIMVSEKDKDKYREYFLVRGALQQSRNDGGVMSNEKEHKQLTTPGLIALIELGSMLSSTAESDPRAPGTGQYL